MSIACKSFAAQAVTTAERGIEHFGRFFCARRANGRGVVLRAENNRFETPVRFRDFLEIQ